jgi:hypothetical protein
MSVRYGIRQGGTGGSRSAMQISNVLNSFTDTLSLGKKSDTAASATAKATGAVDSVAGTSASRKALGEILKKYDVTNITPNAFSQMLKELSQTGALSEKDMQDLAAVRLDLQSDQIDPDEPVNLVDFYNKKIGDAQKQNEGNSSQQVLTPLVSRLGWMEKFSTIHSNPDLVGMDLAA